MTRARCLITWQARKIAFAGFCKRSILHTPSNGGKTNPKRNIAMCLFRLTAVLAISLVFFFVGCVHTAPFRDDLRNVKPESVATMENVNIGGVSQSIWFRGEDRGNPALILLHGGPGAS